MKTDYTGRRFGRLLVLHKLPDAGMWQCTCDCGGQKIARASDMPAGKVLRWADMPKGGAA